MAAQEVQLSVSDFAPLAVGFFGLGTGYLIYFSQELFGWPARDERVNAATGVWGIWMPGFMQLLTGTYLFVGLAWFHTFREKPLYMAALAFTAYGVHWFAIGYNRAKGVDPRPNAGMTVAYTIISVLGIVVFFKASDWPVGLLFIGLTLIYVSDFFASAIGLLPETMNKMGERSLGLWHLLTGLWLMYLTWATALNLSNGMKLPL
ncbi:MAG TPA: hypothetical protein VF218_13190 [Acidothermaceae bacterium]|jgi:hypothetical protein